MFYHCNGHNSSSNVQNSNRNRSALNDIKKHLKTKNNSILKIYKSEGVPRSQATADLCYEDNKTRKSGQRLILCGR